MKRPKRLNAQGLARKEPLLMTHLLPEPGNTLVSIDLGAGEPTVTSHFSKDKNYKYATFDGIGKVPHYNGDVLMIDDLYLMVASVNPVSAQEIRDNFSFIQDQWMVDPEIVKKKLDKTRKLNKMGTLGMGYGMGPKKMVRQFNDAGFKIEFKDAQGLWSNYWQLFSGIDKLSRHLQKQLEIDGYIVNPFGYRLTPEKVKAFNYFIQSSVSGLMHVFGIKLFSAAEYSRLVTVIHDEFLVEVPTDKVDDFRIAKEVATESLNSDLNWDVKVRTGFVTGDSWYSAK